MCTYTVRNTRLFLGGWLDYPNVVIIIIFGIRQRRKRDTVSFNYRSPPSSQGILLRAERLIPLSWDGGLSMFGKSKSRHRDCLLYAKPGTKRPVIRPRYTLRPRYCTVAKLINTQPRANTDNMRTHSKKNSEEGASWRNLPKSLPRQRAASHAKGARQLDLCV